MLVWFLFCLAVVCVVAGYVLLLSGPVPTPTVRAVAALLLGLVAAGAGLSSAFLDGNPVLVVLGPIVGCIALWLAFYALGPLTGSHRRS